MIRPAVPADVPALVELVRALASHQGAPGAVALDEDGLEAAIFGAMPRAAAHLADEAGQVVGMAIWYRTFSTWTGRHGIWLEDLFVRPDRRRSGIATALVASLARLARAEGAARLEWSVLDGNDGARRFYAALGAARLEETTVNRLSGEALAGLAERAP